MERKKEARRCCNTYHAESLIPSDTRILTHYTVAALMLTIMAFGIPFALAVFKQWGWY